MIGSGSVCDSDSSVPGFWEFFKLTKLVSKDFNVCQTTRLEKCTGCTRDTREWWPLLIVETEANGDSKNTVRTYERGPSLVGSLRSSCRYKRYVRPALAALVCPVQNIFASPYIISVHLSTLPSKQGRQSCRVMCLLVCVCGLHSTVQ